MADPESPGRPSEPSFDLAAQVAALDARVDRLVARLEEDSGDLHAELKTILEVLQLVHDDDPGARRRLARLRSEAAYEEAFSTPQPLVSIVIPTWKSTDTLIARAIPSALAQTHPNVEVIVVGDCSPPEVAVAIAELDDPRVRFHNLTVRGPYDDDPHRAWLASGTPGVNAGVALARGLWIAPLGDDDAFVPQHVERLLRAARERRLEFVYGRIAYTFPDGRSGVVGEFPPRVEQVGLQAAIYHSGLSFLELELGHALFGKPNDWGLVHRMMRVGVRIGMVEDVSVEYWPSMRALERQQRQPPQSKEGSSEYSTRLSELEVRLAEEQRRAESLGAELMSLTQRLEQPARRRSSRLTGALQRLWGRL